jgi:hypothetical protein
MDGPLPDWFYVIAAATMLGFCGIVALAAFIIVSRIRRFFDPERRDNAESQGRQVGQEAPSTSEVCYGTDGTLRS